MRLAKYVKFREEKFGGVLFETRSEKVYTLTPTAAAVVQEIQAGTAPVFVGPWNDFSGNEALYWIPFVRWVAEAYGLPPERLIVLSRDNVGDWYVALAHRYLVLNRGQIIRELPGNASKNELMGAAAGALQVE